MRDGWICQICGEPTTGRIGTEPLDAQADHKIPLAAGGTDDLDNLRCAHARCNALLGASGFLDA